VGAAETPGAVLRVSDVPDPATLTYEVEISVDARAGGASTGAAAGTETVQDKLTAGEVVGVRFVTGKVTGIWIPLTAVSAQGDRHVFLAQGGIAYRTAVTLNETHGMQVRVDGLSAGDLLILEGAHRLTEGDLLDVTQEEAAP
jgi:multidrug efflux pump subunit AcrA (membrane-fusion protein)